ncbi:MAG: hypothetical protein PHU06_15015 [Gallionella sp.]|nr:hypothetical protein [Gallionella sp.]
MLNETTATVSQIRQHESDAKQSIETIKAMESFISGQGNGNPAELNAAIAAIQRDPTADPIVRLRAEAIAASETKQADKAYALWNALTQLVPDDANDHFNAGYWAQHLGIKLNGNELIYWMKQAGEHYKKCLTISPQADGVANNWGIVLDAEAKVLAASDLTGARKLWRQASDKYQLALTLKSDKHDTAFNWGGALAGEAKVLAASDLAGACKLWRQAGEKYQLALIIKQDKYEAAFNWGFALTEEAEAVVGSDLACARKLWQQACNKYQLALNIKADMHEAANNWAATLMREAIALGVQNDAESNLLRNRAEQLLLQHANAAPKIVAYGLACLFALRGEVVECLNWLRICHIYNVLPACFHLKTDTNFDKVRSSPEFVVWLQTVCPDLPSA